MSRESKNILSWVFAVIGAFFFPVIFNTLGLIFGLQVRDEGGSSAPAIVNGVLLLIGVFMIFMTLMTF